MTCGRGRAKRWPFAGVLAVLAGGLALAPAQTPKDGKDAKPARDDSKVNVPLPTVDHAELSGTFYRGTRGRDTPCVLMIHDRGMDRSKAEWDGLARELQKEGYAVLTLDLRGHGTSKTVTKDFWNNNFANLKSGYRGGGLSKSTSVSAENMKQGYWPWLANDLAAARRFLDNKNDAGEVNARSIIVIGAGEGASLGMLWVASEFQRVYSVGVVFLKSNGERRLAGDDIAGCVWISPQSRPKEGGYYNFDNWVKNYPAIREKVPMGFVYGEKDANAKRDCEQWLATLKRLPGGKTNDRPNKAIEIKNTVLAGHNLLADQSLGVTQKVVDYCSELSKARKALAWEKNEPDTNQMMLVNLRPFGFNLP